MQMNDECFKLLVLILENTPDQNYFDSTDFYDIKPVKRVGVETARWVGYENGRDVMINHKLDDSNTCWRLAYSNQGKHDTEDYYDWYSYPSLPNSEGWRRISKDDYDLALSIVNLGGGFKNP